MCECHVLDNDKKNPYKADVFVTGVSQDDELFHDFPYSSVLFEELKDDRVHTVLLAIGCLLTTVCLALYIEELLFLYKHYYEKGSKFRNFAVLLGVYPVICVASVITLIVPRSTVLQDLITSCYLSICIFMFVAMILDYYGGDQQIIDALKHDKVVLSVPPCCCCCCFILRPITLTEKSLFRIKLCSIQVAFIQPISLFITSVLWTDGKLVQGFVWIKMTNCSNDFPKSEVLLGEIKDDTLNIVLLAIGCLLATVCLALYIEEVLFLHKHYYVKGSKFRNFVILLAVYPVICVSSVITLIVPRSTVLLDLVSSCYLSICIFTFVSMILEYYGGDLLIIDALKHDKVVLSVPPCCCCCCCILKPITLTDKSLFRIKLCSIQVAFIRPILLFISSVLWTDGKYEQSFGSDSGYMYLSIISAASTLFSMYGLIVLYRASKIKLQHFLLRPKFVPLQICILITNLQNLVFSTLAQNDIPDCIGSRGPRVRASAINHALLIVEMLLLSLLARRGYRVIEKEDAKDIDGTSQPTSDVEMYSDRKPGAEKFDSFKDL